MSIFLKANQYFPISSKQHEIPLPEGPQKYLGQFESITQFVPYNKVYSNCF